MATIAENPQSRRRRQPAAVPEWTPSRSAAGRHNPWTIAWILSIATFMEVLDTAIANVSLRHIAGSLAAGLDESTWVITSYLVANAVILPVSGWLSDVIGRKRFYMGCVAIFTVASLLCGLATSLPQLIFFRVLQGIGGGGLVPSEQAMLADTFAPKDRGKAFALYGLAVVVAPTLGPTLGGWITDSYSWHWVFLINVPVGIASLFLCAQFIDEPRAVVRERLRKLRGGLKVDYIGFALVAIGLGSLELMLDEGERYDWFSSPFVRTFAVVAAVSLVSMVLWEWYHRDPVFDVRLLKNRNFAVCMFMMCIVGFTLYSTTTLIPMVLQTQHGYTALLAGLVLTPGGLMTLLCMPLVGYLTTKVPLRNLLAFGLFVLGLATWHMSKFPSNLTFMTAMQARIFQAASLGFLFIPITTLSYHGLAAGRNNVASAMLTVARNISGSVGIALTGTLLAQRTQYHHAVLVEHVNPYNPAAQNALQGLSNLGSGSVGGAAPGLGVLDGLINRMSGIMAFNDVAFVMGIGVLGALVFVPLLVRARAEGGPAAH
ncbi:MAG TPA: DHA2 family efflux MFS transporter permease subunit [Phycisphaerae bacterium]|nr:DHA2 family efflux MFS transporter permease subunit [Phycisphaerales bacterium]HRX85002.1 DHA2 family efflux MFS transporter permease subunit [Phycisphaerae bacterium]